MHIILIIVSVLSFAVNGVCTRVFQLNVSSKRNDFYFYNAAVCFIASITYTLFSGFDFSLKPIEILFAVLFGIFFFSACFFSFLCYECGSMSLTSIITNMSIALPLIYGCVFLQEPFTVMQIIGCVMLCATFIVSAMSSSDKTNKTKFSLNWLLFVAIAFFSNGITAVLQKSYKISNQNSDGNAFMALAYLTASVMAFTFAMIGKNKGEHERKKPWLFCIIITLVSGLGSFLGNRILMQLSASLPAPQLYPFLNGGLCIVISIISCLFLGEKMTSKKFVAVLLGLTAVILLNL